LAPASTIRSVGFVGTFSPGVTGSPTISALSDQVLATFGPEVWPKKSFTRTQALSLHVCSTTLQNIKMSKTNDRKWNVRKTNHDRSGENGRGDNHYERSNTRKHRPIGDQQICKGNKYARKAVKSDEGYQSFLLLKCFAILDRKLFCYPG
jgi:hypothetical protein